MLGHFEERHFRDRTKRYRLFICENQNYFLTESIIISALKTYLSKKIWKNIFIRKQLKNSILYCQIKTPARKCKEAKVLSPDDNIYILY